MTETDFGSEAMTYATRLRLACRHAKLTAPTVCYRSRCALPRLQVGSGLSIGHTGSIRLFSKHTEKGENSKSSADDASEAPDCTKSRRDATAEDGHDPFESIFKKQRRMDLAKASEGENPLVVDAWGRMEAGAKAQIKVQKARIREAKELQAVDQELKQREAEERAQLARPRRVPIPDFLMEFHIHEGRGEEVNVMGRIRAKRMSGKGLMFLDLQNEFQKVQVMVSRKAVVTRQLETKTPSATDSEAEKDARQAQLDAMQAEADLARLEQTDAQNLRPASGAGRGISIGNAVDALKEASSSGQEVAVRDSQDDPEKAKEIAHQHFEILRNVLQVGDHVSVTGLATKTKAGEQTLKATELPQLISPTMEQIPEKLTDDKTKMANRHLDMLVNKDVSDTLRLRAEITRLMREHFYSKRFLEYQTPILAQNAGGAVARPFTSRATEFKDKELALRVAPELWLKRLVVGGVDKVFEIGPAFRNEGIDATHNPEFTMCEFYSAYSNLPELISETEELICSLAVKSHMLIRDQLTALPPLDLSKFQRPFKQVEFIPGLEAAMGIRLPKLTNPGALPELLALLKLSGISLPGEAPNTLPRLLDRLAAMYLEPLSFNEPLFITNHPACMSPLSKSYLCQRTYQLVSARAELFMGGRELANMYEEENNPFEQKKKLAEHRQLVNTEEGTVMLAPSDSAEGLEQGGDDYYDAPLDSAENEEVERYIETDDHGEASPLDQSFVKALDYGLPPTGGWGCGVERLVMLFSGAQRISDVLSFGSLRNVVGLTADDVVSKPKDKRGTASSLTNMNKSSGNGEVASKPALNEPGSRFATREQPVPKQAQSNRFGGGRRP